MRRRPPRSTRTDTLFPYTTLFRSASARLENRVPGGDVNPYLALAAMLAGGLHGIEEELPLEPELRSEEHTSELQSLMRISYAVFCLKKKKIKSNMNILLYNCLRHNNTPID